jgi:hypothetical protein
VGSDIAYDIEGKMMRNRAMAEQRRPAGLAHDSEAAAGLFTTSLCSFCPDLFLQLQMI